MKLHLPGQFLAGKSLRPEAVNLTNLSQIIRQKANKYLANGENVTELELIGSAAYDIHIDGSDYDYVLRLRNRLILLRDWKGRDFA